MLNNASDYRHVTNATDCNICGNILPVRDARNDGSSDMLKREDVAFLAEAILDRLQDYYTATSEKTIPMMKHAQVLRALALYAKTILFASRGSIYPVLLKRDYQFGDISTVVDYDGSVTKYIVDLYPDCLVDGGFLRSEDFDTNLSLSFVPLKADLLRKLFYLVKLTDSAYCISPTFSASGTKKHCSGSAINASGSIVILASLYSGTTAEHVMPSYSLSTYNWRHGDYAGKIAEIWYEDMVSRITIRRPAKWVKLLVREVISGNLNDTYGNSEGTSKMAWRLIDLELVEGENGYVWQIPTQFFGRDYCRSRAIANGFPELANFENGTSTKNSGTIYSPRFSFDFNFVQCIAEFDWKTSLKDVNWTWQPQSD